MSDSRYTDLGLQPLAGEWRHGRAGRRLKVSNPFDGSLLLEIEQADRDDLDAAYAKAAEVQPAWAALGPSARAAVLYKAVEVFDRRHEEIVDWIIRESGSTRLKAEIEWGAARAITLESASFPARVHGRIVESDVPGKESRVYRSAIGVVGVISPWNFPLHLTQRSIAPALALGNAVVVKPASDTPVCGGLLLARIFEEAGLPAGLFSVVVGPGSEIGDAFVEHPVPGLVTFTGSTPVGRNIGRIASGGAHLKHVALELGGNSPFVVLGDADLEQAVNAAVFGKFLHQGQICMAINRIIVEDSLYDASPRASSSGSRVSGSAIRSAPIPRSGRSSTRASSKACWKRSAWPARKAPSRCTRAASMGSCWLRTYSARSPRRWRSPAMKSSARWSACSARATRRMRWSWPTPANTGCPARCSAATWNARCALPASFARG